MFASTVTVAWVVRPPCVVTESQFRPESEAVTAKSPDAGLLRTTIDWVGGQGEAGSEVKESAGVLTEMVRVGVPPPPVPPPPPLPPPVALDTPKVTCPVIGQEEAPQSIFTMPL